MTTVEIAQRLLRYTTVRDLANLSADDGLDLGEAIGSALRDWFHAAPTAYSRRTISATLGARRTVSGVATVAGSKIFSAPSGTDLSGFVGGTCRMEGDAEYNRLDSTGTFLFAAASTGTGTLEYWGDAVQLNTFARLITDPQIRGQRIRMWSDDDRDPHTMNDGSGNWWWRGIGNLSLGTPERYWVDSQSVSSGGDAPFVLRVYPLPSSDVQVSFDVEVFAGRVTLADMTAHPRELPLPDEHAESILIPLAAEELIGSPIFSGNAEAIRAKALRARRRAASIPPPTVSRNRILTPVGW